MGGVCRAGSRIRFQVRGGQHGLRVRGGASELCENHQTGNGHEAGLGRPGHIDSSAESMMDILGAAPTGGGSLARTPPPPNPADADDALGASATHSKKLAIPRPSEVPRGPMEKRGSDEAGSAALGVVAFC